MPSRLLAALATLAIFARQAAAADAPAIDYNRDIRPILSSHCFACHGPDDNQRQAGLRLDLPGDATKPAESGKRAIVAGHPEQSELVARIFADDEAQRMPPPESNKTLSAGQKALLKGWIASGATSAAHWSLVAPLRPPLPTVSNQNWARNPIDQFVLARLEQEGLAPSPEADRLALARRLYLDLLGLLPTQDEADRFARDTRPEAYEELVERLLASPHYGERWARRWLDLARYADSNGYEKDRPRSIWPYRDWVIRALNADMPFDRFTIEQIAGDLLPGADRDARVATGFHRNTMINEEGGIDVEEFRFYSVVDRVNTTGAVWLGLTIGCAQCHNHKFDPFSQREYYQLLAMLNNADETELAVPQVAIAERRQAIEAQIAGAEAERAAQLDAAKFATWSVEAARTAQPWSVVAPRSVVSANHATMSVLPDRSVLASGDKPNQDTYVVEFTSELPRLTAIRLEVLPHDSLPLGGPGRAPLFTEGDFFLGEVSLAALLAPGGPAQQIALKTATHSHAAEKTSAQAAIDGDLDTGWSIKGRVGQASHAVFTLAEPLAIAAGASLRLTLEQRYIHQMTIGRFRISLSAASDAHATPFGSEVEAALLVEPQRRGPAENELLRSHYASTAPEFAEVNKKLSELRKSLPAQPTTLVMEERDGAHHRVTRLAHRGEFLSPRDPVEPGVPAVLHSLSDHGKDRLALARWLVDARNPLVARVVMNRQWQAVFGRGLVRTTEDFGVRGEPPSHPELLDYLATEFIRGGWSMRHMHRLFVTSATYRQSSRWADGSEPSDPDNVWLARGPRLRVEAETVRDMALGAGGLLDRSIGGASVYPPQPGGVSELAYGAAGWPTSQGAARYRRGLYTYAKRTSPYAAFVTFDGPSGETCTVRRDRSNTPLQALTLLNDAVFVEAAQAIARGVIQAPTSNVEERARLLFRTCLTRDADAEELGSLARFFEAQRSRFEQYPSDAKEIAGRDEPPDRLAELAAWTLVARAILNLDEFVSKE